MRVGDAVRTAMGLPGIPAGSVGAVAEVRRLFVLVSFEDGRQGYYTRHQLTALLAPAGADQAGGEPPTVPLGVADASLPRGSHCCLLPSTSAAALNRSAGFAAAGLLNSETVVCGLPARLRSAFMACLKQAGAGIGSGTGRDRVVFITPSELYLPRSRFGGQAQLDRTTSVLVELTGGNPNGARAFAYAGQRHSTPGWWEYEEGITPMVMEAGITCLCVYDSSGWETDSWRLAAALHPYVVRDNRVSRGDARFA